MDITNTLTKSAERQGTSQNCKQSSCGPSLFQALRGLLPSFDLITSILSTILRLFAGVFVARERLGARPAKLLKLYDIEGDYECRRVREALTTLDLDCIILPCPRKGTTYRAEAEKLAGRADFPLLFDANTDSKIYGADAIVAHLFKAYGKGGVPFMMRHPFIRLFCFIATLLRGFRGLWFVQRQRNNKITIDDTTSLELYSYEGSAHCRLVREVLCEMEIPYLLHNVGKRSPSRVAFVKRSGRMMVPYLVDKQQDKSHGMFESQDIIKYLHTTY
eukprot:TRINITY_DN8283_c0_g1_i1.p1 TRINITY_DN8283_c0_g1~~TRINITY_DN8283_c0_g1_i1.p1  ORF type:complete len:290 (-),score=66.19 TRINITY_DN8283_c0_g1_i1:79-903(-)